MAKFIIKETLYSDQESESFFLSVAPSYSGPFVSWTYLDSAKIFSTREDAEKVTMLLEFEHLNFIITDYDQELKSLKKGYYEENARIRFHYVVLDYDLLGRGEFSTRELVEDGIRIESERKRSKESGR